MRKMHPFSMSACPWCCGWQISRRAIVLAFGIRAQKTRTVYIFTKQRGKSFKNAIGSMRVLRNVHELVLNPEVQIKNGCQSQLCVFSLIYRWLVLTCNWVGIYPMCVEPASPRENHGDVSWVVSTPRSPVSASLHLLALQLKPSLPGLRAPEHPLFTFSLLVLIQVTRRGRKG